MNFKLIIISFFLAILCSTFTFSYFSLPNNQFIEQAEEENKESSLSTFSVEEYIAEGADLKLFSHIKNIRYFNINNTLITLIKEVIVPPPNFI